MLSPVTRLQLSSLGAFLLMACDPGSASGAKGGGAEGTAAQKTTAEAKAGGAAKTEGEPSTPAAGGETQELGSVTKTEVIDLNAIVNKTPEEVEALLGANEGAGSDRISCVRFVPERVFFACKQELRVYKHPEFEEIRVDFEDGLAAQVALIGLPGSGEFEPKAALGLVGVSVPGEARERSEAVSTNDGSAGGNARIWEWGNSSARLILGGQQQRVRLSIVEDDWARTKLELINNHPLNDEQKARIKQPRTATPPASEAK